MPGHYHLLSTKTMSAIGNTEFKGIVEQLMQRYGKCDVGKQVAKGNYGGGGN